MVTEANYNTSLEPNMVMNLIKGYLSSYSVYQPNNETLELSYRGGNRIYEVAIIVQCYDYTNRVFIKCNLQYTTFITRKSLLAEEVELSKSIFSKLADFEKEVKVIREKEAIAMQEKEIEFQLQNLLNHLQNSVSIMVPNHIDSNAESELIFVLNNLSGEVINNISISFPESEDFFEISGNITLSKLHPGMEIEHNIRIKPKFNKGSFPLKIMIHGNGVAITKSFTIKVGGTEIY